MAHVFNRRNNGENIDRGPVMENERGGGLKYERRCGIGCELRRSAMFRDIFVKQDGKERDRGWENRDRSRSPIPRLMRISWDRIYFINRH